MPLAFAEVFAKCLTSPFRVVCGREMSDLLPTRMITMSGLARARQSANQVCNARKVSRLSHVSTSMDAKKRPLLGKQY